MPAIILTRDAAKSVKLNFGWPTRKFETQTVKIYVLCEQFHLQTASVAYL